KVEALRSGGAYRVVNPQGEEVRAGDSNKPLRLHGTPSPSETRNIQKLLEHAGVIATGNGREARRVRTPEGKSRQNDALERGTKERQRRRQAEADALYNRLYPLLKGL